MTHSGQRTKIDASKKLSELSLVSFRFASGLEFLILPARDRTTPCPDTFPPPYSPPQQAPPPWSSFPPPPVPRRRTGKTRRCSGFTRRRRAPRRCPSRTRAPHWSRSGRKAPGASRSTESGSSTSRAPSRACRRNSSRRTSTIRPGSRFPCPRTGSFRATASRSTRTSPTRSKKIRPGSWARHRRISPISPRIGATRSAATAAASNCRGIGRAARSTSPSTGWIPHFIFSSTGRKSATRRTRAPRRNSI